MGSLDKILENHRKVIEEGCKTKGSLKYRSYAITALRGGVGKSTLAFNLAYEMSAKCSLLVADLCAQCNLTEMLMRGSEREVTILNVLRPMMLGPAFGIVPSSPSYEVSRHCEPFKAHLPCFVIPGDAMMFAFPSNMYQQLQLATADTQDSERVVKRLLESLKEALNKEAKHIKAEGILMDTSPFYAGGTHLAWCAADAVIIPIRVDEHSISSLELTLDLMSNPNGDFMVWNKRAGGRQPPKVAAIVMTMVGAKGKKKFTPDRASQMYIERALRIAEKHQTLFGCADPADAFVITDDFVSSGRISGAKGIPISKLKVDSFHTVEGRRLQVNASVTRYQRELAYLTSIL
ncbi:MAG: ParA family protein [Myxococcales bacterium]|nr:MAG: ParA family protein [Myxococcales bacterium]